MKTIYVIFDHHCPFCSFWANKLLSWDTDNQLYIVSSTSSFAAKWAADRGIDKALFKRTLVVYEPPSGWYVEADALRCILNTVKKSPLPIKIILWLTPNWLVNLIYRFVSKFRHQSVEPCPLDYLEIPEKANRIIL